MTDEDFLKLRRGDVVAPRPGEPYVVTEIRAEGAVVVRSVEIADPASIRVLHAYHGTDVLEMHGLRGLIAGDVVQPHGGLSYIVTANDGRSVTAVTTAMLTLPTDWTLVRSASAETAWRPPERR